jgi:hypothetical protein
MMGYYGVRLARTGAERLNGVVESGTLNAVQRAWIRAWLVGPRSGEEIISGMRVKWLSNCRAMIDTPSLRSWYGSAGPLTDAGVPEAVNPEAISDRDIAIAWRRLTELFRDLEEQVPWGPDAEPRVRKICDRVRDAAAPFARQDLAVIEKNLIEELARMRETRALLLDALAKDE